MHVVHEKNPVVEPREQLFHLLLVKLLPRTRSNTFEPVQHSRLVAICLQATDEPRTRVCQSFVIEIDWVLCSQNYTEAKCTALFQQSQQRQFRGRICDRREVT